MTDNIQGTPIRLSADFSTETRSQKGMAFKVMKGKNLQPRLDYPARFSFIFDGEIKSFPDKQKLREFSTTKPALQQITKGSSLGRKHKRRKRPTENKPKTIKKMVIRSCILIITVNVNGLKAPNKKHRWSGWMLALTTWLDLTPPPNFM